MKNPLAGPGAPIDIAVLCPLREEFRAVRRYLDNVVSKKRSGLHFDQGTLRTAKRTWTVALLETGSGVANLAFKTTKIIHTLRPTCIFLIGIAGGVKDVKIGDVVVAEKAYGYGAGKDTKDDLLSRPNGIPGPPKITELLRQLARDYELKVSHKIYLAAIASGDKVLSSKDSYTAQLIKRLYNDTFAVEMEAYGFAMAARDEGIPYANIRGISDLLDSKHRSDHDGSRALAADRAASFWVQLLHRLTELEEFKTNTSTSSYTRSPLLDESDASLGSPVYYLNKPHRSWYSWRRERRGILYCYADHLLVEGKVDQEIRNIQHLERVRMPGDFGARWVKLSYEDGQGNPQAIFLSDAKFRFPVLANLFSGGRSLMKRLSKKYMERGNGVTQFSSI